MFEKLSAAPPDAILGLTEAFRADTNPQKINLSVGVYKDSHGKTPTLDCVREAERRLVEADDDKAYLPIDGHPTYQAAVRQLLLGGHDGASPAATLHTPGGTGALRVAADFLKDRYPDSRVWLSSPTWANHAAIFRAAGVEMADYAYLDNDRTGLDFTAMTDALQQIPSGDVVLVHACCHNPTGVDPSPEQWSEIGKLLAARGILPLVDFAYQGFGDGLAEDSAGLHALLEASDELIVCSSFSKNFGLYNERVGALTLLGKEQSHIDAALSHAKTRVRANYSNPPAHGARIVTTILGDSQLRSQWEGELADMRNRINSMRTLFVRSIAELGIEQDFSFITQQRGMFSFSGLTKDQVERLRQEYSIYIVGSGRINVAGITSDNVGRLCEAIKTVL